MKKRFLCTLITLCMVLGIIPLEVITSSAENTKSSWGNVYDITWYTETKASTYHISTAEELAGLAYLVNARKTEFLNETVYLDADINLAGKEWIPIDWGGWTDYPRGCPGFRGTLDGQGHTIYNMTITSIVAGEHAGAEPVGSDEYYSEIGLFGRMDGLLNNLNMQSANITLPDNEAYKVLKAGILCGSLCDDTNPPSQTITTRGIFDCTVTNSIIKGNAIEYADVFAAYIYDNTTISGCTESGNQIITNTMWSGCYDQDMVASYDSTTTFVIKTEEELAAISALSSSGKDFSGKTVSLANDLDMSQYTWSSIPVFNGTFEGNNHAIVALRISMIRGNYHGFISTTSSCTIRNLTIDISFENMINKDFHSNCGGLIGNALNATVIVENCSVFGTVGMQEENNRAGAIIGYASHSNVTINKTNNYATIMGDYAGGLVGQAWAGTLTITNSVNAGSVYSFSGLLGCAAGGFVGVAENINLRLDKCAVLQTDVNTGTSLRISGKEQSGGFIGVVNDYFIGVSDVAIRNSYCSAQVVATNDDSVASAFFNILYSHAESPLAVNITASYFGGTLTYEGSKKANDYLYLCFYVNKGTAPKYNVSCNDTYLLAHFKADSNGDGKEEDLRNYGGIDVTNGVFTNSSYRHFQVINTWGSTSTFDRKEIAIFKNFDFLKNMNDVSNNADKNNANIWTSKNSTNDVYQYGMPYLFTPDIDAYGVAGKKVSASNIVISGIEKSDLLYTSYRNFSSAYGKADGSAAHPWQSAYVGTGMTFRINTYNSTNDECLDFSRQLFHRGDEISLFIVNADKDGYTGDIYTYTVTGSENNYNDINGAVIGQICLNDFKNAAGVPFSAGAAGSRSLYFTVKFREESNAALSNPGECYLRYRNSKSECAKNVFLKANDLKLSLGKYEGGTVTIPDSIYSNTNQCYFGNSATGLKVNVAANRGYQLKSLTFKDTMSVDVQTIDFDEGSTTWIGFWKGKSGSSSLWQVEAQFEKKSYSVSFSGEHCHLCDENGNEVTTAQTALYYEKYKFKLQFEDQYKADIVTINGATTTPDANNIYTVNNVSDAVRIIATAKSYDGWQAIKETHYTVNSNDWQKTDFVVTAINGYLLSMNQVEWSNSLTANDETKSGLFEFFVKNTSNGSISAIVSESYKIDKTAPTAEIKLSTNSWKTFLNTVTFGLFFKDTQTLEISVTDTGSGVKTVEYVLSNSVFTSPADITQGWTPLPAENGNYSLPLEKNSKQYVYISVTDNLGHQYVINSTGIVIYTDSVLESASAEFNFDFPANIDISMQLNGNTLNQITNGTTVLVEDTDYTINGSIATIKKEYLASALCGDSLTLTFRFDPMKESFIGTENVPATAEFTVTRHIHTPKVDDNDCSTPVFCSECNYITTTAKTHNFTSKWMSGKDEHWHKCQNDGCTVTDIKTAHYGGLATCHSKAVCEACAVEYGEFDPNNHDGKTEIKNALAATENKSGYTGDKWCLGCNTLLEKGSAVAKLDHTHNMVKTEAKEATHKTSGNIAYYTCSKCGKLYKDAEGKNEITLADTVLGVIAHKANGSKWNSDEENHWYVCSCGEVLGKEPHHFVWITEKKESSSESGSKHEECSVCGYKKSTVEIPATGKSDSPQTGDKSNMVLWISLLFVCGGVLTALEIANMGKKTLKLFR